MSRAKRGHQPDYAFLALVWLLTAFGLIMLSSASSDLGKIKFNDTYYYVKHQIYFGLSLGIVGFLMTSLIYYRTWQKLAVPLLLISLAVLALVLIPGIGYRHAGANRWINLGPFSVQPAEFLKLTFIIYVAAWLSSEKFRQKDFWTGFLPFLAICAVIGILIALQPSTTTVLIILAGALAIYFVSGAKLSHVLGVALIGLLFFALLIYITPYRSTRISTYLNSLSNSGAINTESEGYHLNQTRIAIGSGGLTGVGFGKSTTKYRYLPEPIGDSIFAVIAEELGFLGTILLLALFVAIFWRGFVIARNSRDEFAKLVTIGFIVIIAIQTLINIAAISGTLPLTGVPLPFVSYGGTSLAVLLTMAGVIVNISKYTS